MSEMEKYDKIDSIDTFEVYLLTQYIDNDRYPHKIISFEYDKDNKLINYKPKIMEAQ